MPWSSAAISAAEAVGDRRLELPAGPYPSPAEWSVSTSSASVVNVALGSPPFRCELEAWRPMEVWPRLHATEPKIRQPSRPAQATRWRPAVPAIRHDRDRGTKAPCQACDLHRRGPDIDRHDGDSGRAARQPEGKHRRTVPDGQHYEAVRPQAEPIQGEAVLAARITQVVGGERRAGDRQVDQGPGRRLAMDPPEPFDDLAQLNHVTPRQGSGARGDDGCQAIGGAGHESSLSLKSRPSPEPARRGERS